MHRFRLSHILLWGLISPLFVTTFTSAQNGVAPSRILPAPYQRWLDEDVRYLISDEERAQFEALGTDQQRDKYVEEFWERRNPSPGSAENSFKAEHYRRLAYTNQNFAAKIPGWKTDRGRIYILYGPPDEREQHPGRTGVGVPADTPLQVLYPSDVWRYHILKGIGRDVVFEFIDQCRCGEYPLRRDSPKNGPRSPKEQQKSIPVKTGLRPQWKKQRTTQDVFVAIADKERAESKDLETYL